MSLADLTLVPLDGIKRGTTYKHSQKGKKPKGLLSPSITVPDLPTWKPGSVQPITLEALREEAQRHVQAALSAPVGTLSVLTNPTGSGKSTAVSQRIEPGTVLAFSSYTDLEEKKAALLEMGYTVKAVYGRTEEPKEREYDKQHRWEQAGCDHSEEAKIRAQRALSLCRLQAEGWTTRHTSMWLHETGERGKSESTGLPLDAVAYPCTVGFRQKVSCVVKRAPTTLSCLMMLPTLGFPLPTHWS